MEFAVRHDEGGHRFLAEVEGHTAVLAYAPLDERTLDFESTFVPNALRGRLVGTRLVLHALTWARGQRLSVVPSCWFVRHVVDRHPEFHGLLAR